MKASPYAQKLAREAGVDISQANPTGPEGRIVASDVQTLIKSGGGKETRESKKTAEEGGKTPSQESQPTSSEVHFP